MRKKLLGPEHPATLLTIGNLARIYSEQGRWDEAEHLELQVMNIRKKLFGTEHQHTLLSMGNLASTYFDQGRWNEAEQLELQVIDIRKKLLGTEHPDILKSTERLARIRQGEVKQKIWSFKSQIKKMGRVLRNSILFPKYKQ
jgi:tetratricopeptide (TPR) repeat protein